MYSYAHANTPKKQQQMHATNTYNSLMLLVARARSRVCARGQTLLVIQLVGVSRLFSAAQT